MNKILAFVGFLAGMNSVFGMDISETPEFEYNESSNTLVCRNMKESDFKKYENYLDCALHISFDNCHIPEQGVSCTNAWMLSFYGCDKIEKPEDVFKYVSLYYTPYDEVDIYIEKKLVSQ